MRLAFRLRNTAGTELPPRSRTMTTTLRLPVWFRGQAAVDAVLAQVARASRSRRNSRHRLPPPCLRRRPRGPSFPRPSPRAACGRARKPPCRTVPRSRLERQRRLALDLIAEDRDGREIGAQRQLVRGEQRPARDREIAFCRPGSGSAARRSGAGSRRRPGRRTDGQTGAPFGFRPADLGGTPPRPRRPTCGRPERG